MTPEEVALGGLLDALLAPASPPAPPAPQAPTAAPFRPAWSYPPGFRETSAAMAGPRYGWAVLTPSELVVLEVTDWAQALQTMPYRWLNSHPSQRAPPAETLPLVEEVMARHRRAMAATSAPNTPRGRRT